MSCHAARDPRPIEDMPVFRLGFATGLLHDLVREAERVAPGDRPVMLDPTIDRAREFLAKEGARLRNATGSAA